MTRQHKTLLGLVLPIFISGLAYQLSWAQEELTVLDEMLILAPLPLNVEMHSVKPNSSVHESFVNAGIDPQMIHAIVQAARPNFNLRYVQAGTKYSVARLLDGTIHSITFDISPLSRLEVKYSHNQWSS